MKNLFITLGLAVAVVAGAMIIDKFSSSDNKENVRMVKSVIDKDANGRVEQELIMEHMGNEWVESQKRVTNYTENSMETISYKKEAGEWTAFEKSVTELNDGCAMSRSTYSKTANGEWIKTKEYAQSDLCEDADIVEDMLFDSKGNLVMHATYKWDEEGKSGLTKEEYEYAQGSMQKVTSYAWAGNDWKKETVSSLIER